MIIEELHLASFKGFRDFTTQNSLFTNLVGLNSNGKTSILQAIQLLYDIFLFTFGNKEQPDFASVRWDANPSEAINRISFGDPDAIWLFKRLNDPCRISAKFSGNVELRLEVKGRNNYSFDFFNQGTSIKNELTKPENKKIVNDIFTVRPVYVPPIGAISPVEDFAPFEHLKQQLHRGQVSERWRSHLYWLWNDGRKEYFDEVVEIVKEYLPNAKILPPKLTHDNPPRVLIQFEEEKTVFDISMSGGGLRTILNLAIVLRFSNSKCFLFDEPDAHLHATIQKAIARMLFDHAMQNNVQIFVATHAPDFIAEIPVENLVWIDRNENEGIFCNEIGRVLADLGAITKSDAIRAYGANKILFLEGSTDRNILSQLIARSGRKNPFEDKTVIIANLPSGKSNDVHLPMFQKLLRESFKLEIKIACITDKDYDVQKSDNTETADETIPLIIALNRKEIENYFLDPALIQTALRAAAEERKRYTGLDIPMPSYDEIKEFLFKTIDGPKIYDTVRYQILHKIQSALPSHLDPSTKYKEAENKFIEYWNDQEWRIRHCPGKEVLRALRRWCQDTFSISLSTRQLTTGLKECPHDIMDIAQQLEAYFYAQ
jgi:energy-coupling factor transporter ATP-binding protein EcfA2